MSDKRLPERLAVGTDYGGAYADGIEIVFAGPPTEGEIVVADVIPACDDGCEDYDHRALAAELVKRWNEHESLLATAARLRSVESGEPRLARIRLIAEGASAKEPAARLFARLLAVSLEANGVTSESGDFIG